MQASLLIVPQESGFTEGSQILIRKSRWVSHSDWVRHFIPVDGSRHVSLGLSCLDGYWAPEGHLREPKMVYDGRIAPETGVRFLGCWDRDRLVPCPDVVSLLVTSHHTADLEDITRCYPNLQQRSLYRRGPSSYRHPDGQWRDTAPEQGLSCLWVHGQSELELIQQAQQVLIPVGLMHPCLIEAGQYHIQANGRYYLLTRLPQPKGARTTVSGIADSGVMSNCT